MYSKSILIVILTLFFGLCFEVIETYAQESVTVQGSVTDAQTGEPLPGVSIMVEGTTLGTSTNRDGNYELSVNSLEDRLIFSFIGYRRATVAIDGRSEINIQLELEIEGLDELVVIGYGIERRANVIGSVATVRSEQIANAPVSMTSNALAGRLPGAIFMQDSGEPGANAASIRIRGTSTLNNNDVLIVVDGVPGRSLNVLNPADIESISVLKDASAAIYGARAANGVILVTTKRGGADSSPTFTYDYSHGFLSPTKLPQMVDAPTYATMIREMESYRDIPEENRSFSQKDVERFRSGNYPWTHPNTDWFNEALRSYSTTTRHNMSVAGGAQNVRYFASFGNQFEDGIYQNNNTSYDRYNLRANIDVDVNEYIDLGLDLYGVRDNRMYPTRSANNIYETIIRMYPTSHANFPNGLPGPDIERGDQPMVMASDATGFNDHVRTTGSAKLSGSLNFPGIEGLRLSGSFSYDLFLREQKVFQQPWTVYSLDVSSYLAAGNTGAEDGSAFLVPSEVGYPDIRMTQTSEDSRTRTTNTRLQYVTSLADGHNIDAFVAYERYEWNREGFNAFRRDFRTTQLPYLFAGGDDEKDNSSWVNLDASENYFGRISYNYQEKYLFQFSFRRDGSLRFSEASGRWGNFPSVLVGWVPSEHSWWRDNIDFMDYFKLRASFGRMGNDQVARWQYLSTYQFTTGTYFGPDKTFVSGLQQAGSPNPNITWEVANVFNFGWESYFFDNRLNFETDFFFERRSDILVPRNVSVPNFTGISLPDENFGIVENWGFEAVLGYRGARNNLSYGFSGNVAYNRNKIVEADEPFREYEWQRLTGQPIGSRLIYRSGGIFRDEDHVNSLPHVPGARPGDVILEDVSGDGEITSADRVLVPFGSGVTPRLTFGFSFDFSYRNFDLSGLIQGQTKIWRDIFTDYRIGYAGNYFQWDADDRWTPENPDATKPRAYNSNDEYWRSSFRSDFYLVDNSFVRLRNLQLGYSLPVAIQTRLGASDIRFYVSGQNLFLLYSGNDVMDPENYGMGAYPIMRTISMGTRFTF
ncbi:MAG: TonB-dependent receptor [Balneolaceae bacterium]|nr:TonB-dependent receptor [Balneolaceae bacterium]